MTLIDVAVSVELQVQITAAGRAAVLTLTGELDERTVSSFCMQTADVLAAGTVELVLDMQRLYFLDVAGLLVLVELSRKLEQAGGSVVLAGVRPRVREFMDQSVVGRTLRRLPDVAQALAAVTPMAVMATAN
jgi:anti-sigma B factor antagonist